MYRAAIDGPSGMESKLGSTAIRIPISVTEPPVVQGSLQKLSAQYWAKHHTTSVKKYPGYNPINQKNDAGWGNWPFYNSSGKMGKWHAGNDFPAAKGTPVYSMATGTVKLARRYGAYGNMVVIADMDNRVTRGYAHLDTILSNVSARARGGRVIKHGQQIGTVGRTGFDAGSDMAAHLHYEIHPGNVFASAFGNNAGGRKWKTSLKPAAFIKFVGAVVPTIGFNFNA